MEQHSEQVPWNAQPWNNTVDKCLGMRSHGATTWGVLPLNAQPWNTLVYMCYLGMLSHRTMQWTHAPLKCSATEQHSGQVLPWNAQSWNNTVDRFLGMLSHGTTQWTGDTLDYLAMEQLSGQVLSWNAQPWNNTFNFLRFPTKRLAQQRPPH